MTDLGLLNACYAFSFNEYKPLKKKLQKRVMGVTS